MEKRFPILNEIENIPWKAIEPHREQAMANHNQTLERLAERGGLSWLETLAVLHDRPFWFYKEAKIDERHAKKKVLEITNKFKVCSVCGEPLFWGRFSFNQKMCWECFKKEVHLMEKRIDEYPSWLWDKRQQHQEILNHMMAIVAETFGEEW